MTMDNSGVNQIINALEVIYDPKATNDQRREAQIFLESIKTNEESPFWGYQLALPENNGKNYIVRHFGLSLLQNSINKRFHLFNSDKVSTIRNWVIELANKINEDDPHYLKEKLAFLWVSIAKKIWGCFLVKSLKGDVSRVDENDVENQNNDKSSVAEQDLTDGWASMDSDLWNLWNKNVCCRN